MMRTAVVSCGHRYWSHGNGDLNGKSLATRQAATFLSK